MRTALLRLFFAHMPSHSEELKCPTHTAKKKNKSFYFVNKFYFVVEYVINNKTITLKKTVLRYVTRQ